MITFLGYLLAYLVIACLVWLALFIYFMPAINAYGRGHNNTCAILMCNLFFGWTFLGWAVSLIWSATGNVTPTQFSEWFKGI